MAPPANTRSSRLTFSASPGRLGISTTRPTPLKTPLATTALVTTSRVPDVLDATMTPLNVSAPDTRAAAGDDPARTAPIASATTAARFASPLIGVLPSVGPTLLALAGPNKAAVGRPAAGPRAGLQVAVEECAQEGALSGDGGRGRHRAELLALGGQAELGDEPDVVGEPGVLG